MTDFVICVKTGMTRNAMRYFTNLTTIIIKMYKIHGTLGTWGTQYTHNMSSKPTSQPFIVYECSIYFALNALFSVCGLKLNNNLAHTHSYSDIDIKTIHSPVQTLVLGDERLIKIEATKKKTSPKSNTQTCNNIVRMN